MKLLPSLMNSGTKKDDNWHSSAPQDTAAWEQHGHALQHFSIASALLTKLQLKSHSMMQFWLLLLPFAVSYGSGKGALTACNGCVHAEENLV